VRETERDRDRERETESETETERETERWGIGCSWWSLYLLRLALSVRATGYGAMGVGCVPG